MHETTRLRRLPWDEDGRAAFVSPGDGFVNRLANAIEVEIIETARNDARRALALAGDPSVSRAELQVAVRYLASAVQDAALVADLRGERLPAVAEGLEDLTVDEPLWGGASRCVGQALGQDRGQAGGQADTGADRPDTEADSSGQR
ncbi:hypothetical protein WN979_14475 [Streptomyces albidoflavus]|uniref:hypothetical protein n=1 Tax=Streptomyces albidoflavus TaxID=1886 RepID=UPI003251E42B